MMTFVLAAAVLVGAVWITAVLDGVTSVSPRTFSRRTSQLQNCPR